ncbi:MAG: Asp-tRNA(Asn)/Glu-tRNA(Gln) amidotransferase subunit GatC [Spirochaetales bacterium]|nr:Asp-tRNA(Asn)/Glu-tRNA(Gln) amidotransferase subunit GatC [Spirochaetales bacterium]
MIDDKTFNAVLGLCRFSISGTEQEHFKNQIGDIISYVEKLKEIDTSHIDPDLGKTITVNDLRDDAPGESLIRTKLEELSPHFENGFFRVPQIIEEMEEKK